MKYLPVLHPNGQLKLYKFDPIKLVMGNLTKEFVLSLLRPSHSKAQGREGKIQRQIFQKTISDLN